MTTETLELSGWALRKQFVKLSIQPKPTPGSDEADLRMLALVALRTAIRELNAAMPQVEDPQ